MRIRKRPSGRGSPVLEQEQQKKSMNNGLLKTKQVVMGAPAVKQQKQEERADSIRKRKMKQEQGLMALASWAAVMSKREEYTNKKKRQQECPIGCVSEQRRQAEEEIIGEQPRTPPPFAGEKPAEHGKKACSCGKKWGLRQEDVDPSLLRTKRARTWNKNRNNHQQDTADSMARPSHENCGLEHSDEEGEEEDQPIASGVGGGLRRADQEELRRDMGPLLKAVHAVIGEAGMQGLTARETGELIRSRQLLTDGDVPRTVKIAKAMRDSPYLVELGSRGDCNARFVMWSTYLQSTTSVKGTTRGGVSVKTALAVASTTGSVAGGAQVGRRGRRSQPQQRRRRGGHGHVQHQEQQQEHETNSSSTVGDDGDLLARVLMQVQKTLKAQTYQAAPIVHQQAQAVLADVNKDNKPTSRRQDIEQQQEQQRHHQQQQQQQQQQQRVFLIDMNSLPPPASVEINVTIERKPHILEAVNCKPYQQHQQVGRPLLIDLNLAPDDSC